MEDRLIANRFSIEGNVALITGGAGLLGIEHAKSLIGAGAKVYLGDIDKKKAEYFAKKLGDKCVAVNLDVTCEESIKEICSEMIKKEKTMIFLV